VSVLEFVFATVSAFAPPTATEGLQFDPAADLPARERTALRESFERVLPLACDPPPCVGDCPEDQPSISVVIGGHSRDYTLRWVANDPHLDEPLIVEARCELCGLVEAEEQIAADLGNLCARLEAIANQRGRVRVSAVPEQAWVRIDGRHRGRTPWVGEMVPGRHRLEVGARGYGTQARTLQIIPGIEEHEHFELMARARTRPSWPGWTSLGLGIALGIAGTALIAIDGRDWRGRCTGADIDANGNCRYVYRTQPFGIALASLGAASIATGVGLIVWAQHGDQGAALAWGGSF
jgi:hypothetical protein